MRERRSLLVQLTTEPLARPCDEPWSAMTGNERVRHCASCDRDVWDLSAMTAREAELRLLNAPAIPCINFRRDENGRLISRPDPASRPTARVAIGAAAFVATTLLAPGHGTLGGAPAHADATTPPKSDAGKDEKKPPPECVTITLPPGAMPLTPPDPPRLGGAPPPMREMPPTGAVDLRSKKPRSLTIDGVSFDAPDVVRLPPGRHEALLSDGKKTVKKTFTIKKDATVIVDLDR
jgi:hypothetical protein